MSEQFRRKFIAAQLYQRSQEEKRQAKAREEATLIADETSRKLWKIIEKANEKGDTSVVIPPIIYFNDALLETLYPSFYADGVTLEKIRCSWDEYVMDWYTWIIVQEDE